MNNNTPPKYWRMQLHPSSPQQASFYAMQSLAAGFIGLDFERDTGDLFRTTQQALPQQQRDYWAFAHDMCIGDKVLIICHHFPFALVTVAGDYNYVRVTVPEIGVWFRHFRRVDEVRLYADHVTNAASWKQLRMTDTISPLHDPNKPSHRLIESWR
jgi:hypothetical protein